jgi:hypothetical protein
MVLGGGTIADLIHREQRGTAMSVWLMGPSVCPSPQAFHMSANLIDSYWSMRRACNRWFPHDRERLEVELLFCRYCGKCFNERGPPAYQLRRSQIVSVLTLCRLVRSSSCR